MKLDPYTVYKNKIKYENLRAETIKLMRKWRDVTMTSQY